MPEEVDSVVSRDDRRYRKVVRAGRINHLEKNVGIKKREPELLGIMARCGDDQFTFSWCSSLNWNIHGAISFGNACFGHHHGVRDIGFYIDSETATWCIIIDFEKSGRIATGNFQG